jgi:hypothetical protein
MKKILIVTMLILFVVPFISAQSYYTYSKPKQKVRHDIDLITEFEMGLHYGMNWALGSTTGMVNRADVFSLNLGWNNSKFYWGTEFNLKLWDEILDERLANKKDFNQNQFLWLMHMKWYFLKGSFQPFAGCGTDLLTIGEAILYDILSNDDEEEERYNYHRSREKLIDFNTWFVPCVGIRCKVHSGMFMEMKYSFDLSDNFDAMRLQVGVIYQF